MSIDLNALAAQLASQLAAAPVPPRDGSEGTRAPGEPPVVVPAPPRGVRFTDGDVRLGDVLDHTLLRPDATLADIERLCAEARDHRLASVCVNSAWVSDAARLLRGSSVALVSVVGFPFGAVPAAVKAAEAALAVQQGAREVDVVVPLGALRSGQWDEVERDVAAVVAAAGGALVKAIVESALLTPMALVKACLMVRDGGAHYVKTSTGFHSAGGATPETVALMRLAVGDSMGVKASGGIRDGATALAMLAAGATRLGTSAGAALADVRGPGPRRLAELIAVPAAAAGNTSGSGMAGTRAAPTASSSVREPASGYDSSTAPAASAPVESSSAASSSGASSTGASPSGASSTGAAPIDGGAAVVVAPAPSSHAPSPYAPASHVASSHVASPHVASAYVASAPAPMPYPAPSPAAPPIAPSPVGPPTALPPLDPAAAGAAERWRPLGTPIAGVPAVPPPHAPGKPPAD